MKVRRAARSPPSSSHSLPQVAALGPASARHTEQLKAGSSSPAFQRSSATSALSPRPSFSRLLRFTRPQMSWLVAGLLVLLCRLPFSLAVPLYVSDVCGPNSLEGGGLASLSLPSSLSAVLPTSSAGNCTCTRGYSGPECGTPPPPRPPVVPSDNEPLYSPDQPILLTSCGALARNGPTLEACLRTYRDAAWAGHYGFGAPAGGSLPVWQRVALPATGRYSIEAAGASGTAGRRPDVCLGAVVQLTLALERGTELFVMVGQPGSTLAPEIVQFHGAGGTFVLLADNTPLVVAGGGGGFRELLNHSTDTAACSASLSSSDGRPGSDGSLGGTRAGQGSALRAGGGLLGSGGGSGANIEAVGAMFGGRGGTTHGWGDGGFGGGGSCGGGGGYSGGAGVVDPGILGYSGGGGGSYCVGDCAFRWASGSQASYVKVTYLSPPPAPPPPLPPLPPTPPGTLYPLVPITLGTCGATGPNPPSLEDCQRAYSQQPWAGHVRLGAPTAPAARGWAAPAPVWQAIELPWGGVYTIEVAGAAGGGGFWTDRCLGARMRVSYELPSNATLYVIVGQLGDKHSSMADGRPMHTGGGGGSAVLLADGRPLAVAGGGGGVWYGALPDVGGLCDASINTFGHGGDCDPTFTPPPVPENCAGGVGGGGGVGFMSGASLTVDGVGWTGQQLVSAAQAAFHGGVGGCNADICGGFGAGAGGACSGGGGFSGGGGKSNGSASYPSFGGGGGSFCITGAPASCATGWNTGLGYVTITPPLPPPAPAPPPLQPPAPPNGRWVRATVAIVLIAAALCLGALVLIQLRKRRRRRDALGESGDGHPEWAEEEEGAAWLQAALLPPLENPSYDVMVSFREPETGESGDCSALAIAQSLQARGFSVFASTVSIMGGANWPVSIQAAVEGCSAMVIIASPGYGASSWTRRELVLADMLGKHLVPVWHSGTWPPPAAAIYLAERQYLPQRTLNQRLHANGYVGEGIAVEDVVDELVKALEELGVYPVAGLNTPPSQSSPEIVG